MIAIIDYDAGNIKSVEKALKTLGQEVVVTRDPEVILSADRVILPGVGAFGDAMGKLHDYGLVDVIHKVVEKNIPFLGICLGLQLMFESSEETPGVEGLGRTSFDVLNLFTETIAVEKIKGTTRYLPNLINNSVKKERKSAAFALSNGRINAAKIPSTIPIIYFNQTFIFPL